MVDAHLTVVRVLPPLSSFWCFARSSLKLSWTDTPIHTL